MTIDVFWLPLHFCFMKAETRMAHATALAAYDHREIHFSNLNSRTFVFNHNYEPFTLSS
jgi:hypothetical protein